MIVTLNVNSRLVYDHQTLENLQTAFKKELTMLLHNGQNKLPATSLDWLTCALCWIQLYAEGADAVGNKVEEWLSSRPA